MSASHNSRNQLVSQQAGGALRFAGTLDEPAAVTVAGQVATVDTSNRFEGAAPVTVGISTVTVAAQDYAQPPNLRTQDYQVEVTGSAESIAYDASQWKRDRDAFRLFLRFAERQLRHPAASLALEQFDAPLVLAFLDHLEQARGNAVRSRNARLAVMRSFARFLSHEESIAATAAQRILALRASASGLIPERTISIIRRRYSGGYGARPFGMVDSLPTRAY